MTIGVISDSGRRKRAELVSVRTLLSGDARYAADPNGRGYVWGPPEIAQFLLDLESGTSAADPRKRVGEEQLYLGVIAVDQAQRGARAQIFDGQQRIVAIMLFFAFARDRLADSGSRQHLVRLLESKRLLRQPEPRLLLAPADQSWFANHILEPRATLRLPADAPEGGPRRLLASARFMQRAFAGYASEDIRCMTLFLLDRAAFVVAEPTGRAAAVIDFPVARTSVAPQPVETAPAPRHGLVWVDDEREDGVA